MFIVLVLDVSRSSFVTMNSAKIAPFSCIYETFGVKKAKRKQFRENRRNLWNQKRGNCKFFGKCQSARRIPFAADNLSRQDRCHYHLS